MDINIPKVNVNIGLYVISLMAIGYAEKNSLQILMFFGIISSAVSLTSIVISLVHYTKYYIAAKKLRMNQLEEKKKTST